MSERGDAVLEAYRATKAVVFWPMRAYGLAAAHLPLPLPLTSPCLVSVRYV